MIGMWSDELPGKAEHLGDKAAEIQLQRIMMTDQLDLAAAERVGAGNAPGETAQGTADALDGTVGGQQFLKKDRHEMMHFRRQCVMVSVDHHSGSGKIAGKGLPAPCPPVVDQ